MSAGLISLSAKRVQRNIAAYYRLPIPERCEAYKELRGYNTLERTKLVESFLAKHGQLTPEQQLARLFPFVNWENAERHNAVDALVYIVPRSAISQLYGKGMDETTGKVITEEDLFNPKFRKLAGKVALIARPENEASDPEYIIKLELDHVRHLQLPCHGVAQQAQDKYIELRPQFYREMVEANNGAVEIIGIDDFEIIAVRQNAPRMRRERNASTLINEATSTFMQFMAYELLFETSAVLSSFSSFVAGQAGSYGGLEWALGHELTDVTREITHLRYNLFAVKQTFPRDKALVDAIDHFEHSSIVFAARIAKLTSGLSHSSSEPEALKAMARATQILSYEELTNGSNEETAKAILLTKLPAYLK